MRNLSRAIEFIVKGLFMVRMNIPAGRMKMTHIATSIEAREELWRNCLNFLRYATFANFGQSGSIST
jgi:hypothetical protein